MKTSARSSRLVPGLAVVAMSLAALATVAATQWSAGTLPMPRADGGMRAQRPVADAPVQVVRAPAAAAARQRPAACRDCGSVPAAGSRL